MVMSEIYTRLANHLHAMGYPIKEGLDEILRANFNPLEAEVVLALPTNNIPLQPLSIDHIVSKVDLPREELIEVLQGLARRGHVFSGKTEKGEKGYALVHRGFGGFAQVSFWKGERSPFAKKMADLLDTYYQGKTLMQSIETQTKRFQFIPLNKTIEPQMQAVYPFVMLEKVVEKARSIAVAHCPCRMRGQLQGRGCDYPLEVCLKFDEMADHLIENELAREVTKEEALEIIKRSEEAGLVHFVDNAMGDIKHNCNCCSCHCWALSPIKERKIPRDVIMATYFIRETDEGKCSGCGACVDVCPVDALTMGDDFPIVDRDWCVGCGLCSAQCPTSAAKLRPKSDHIPASNFRELHERILAERGLRKA